MSQFYDTAEDIADQLRATEELAGIAVIVDRQRDIAAELQKHLGKVTAAGCLIVTWTGAPNADESADGPRFNSTFTVTGFFKPVLRRGETPADNIIEAAAAALHDWRRPNRSHVNDRLIVIGITPFDSPEFLAYRINLKTTDQL